jgi:hypothetical protein
VAADIVGLRAVVAAFTVTVPFEQVLPCPGIRMPIGRS